jgi:hypothetical protein
VTEKAISVPKIALQLEIEYLTDVGSARSGNGLIAAPVLLVEASPVPYRAVLLRPRPDFPQTNLCQAFIR